MAKREILAFPVQASSTSKPLSSERPQRGLLIIGVFKLVKGSLLLVVAFGLLHFLHRDVRHAIEHVINHMRVDPDNKYIAALLAKLGLVDDRHLKELSGLAAIYAALFLTEGAGLLLRKRWAEYLTVIATASLIPLEIYEVTRHISLPRIFFLVGNVAIVIYLIFILRRKPSAV
jgi:uncharacterized membrane protein (DUF2068 family)